MYRFGEDVSIVRGVGSHGNNVIYGCVYILKDDFFHFRTVDSFFNCSLSSLGRNHSLDINHRLQVEVTPISFDSIDEFERLMYKEMQPIRVEAYFGNLQHHTIQKRVNRTQKFNYRIKDGVFKQPFLKQLWEVLGEK